MRQARDRRAISVISRVNGRQSRSLPDARMCSSRSLTAVLLQISQAIVRVRFPSLAPPSLALTCLISRSDAIFSSTCSVPVRTVLTPDAASPGDLAAAHLYLSWSRGPVAAVMYPVRLVNEACGLERHYRLTAIGAGLVPAWASPSSGACVPSSPKSVRATAMASPPVYEPDICQFPILQDGARTAILLARRHGVTRRLGLVARVGLADRSGRRQPWRQGKGGYLERG